MESIKEVFNFSNLNTFSDYLSADKDLDKIISKGSIDWKNTINIAVVSSSTTNGIKQILRVKSAYSGILVNIYVSSYNQYAQDILNLESELYKFKPQLIFLNVDLRTLSGDIYFNPYLLSDRERLNWAKESKDFLLKLVSTIENNSDSKIILHNLEVPFYSPLGLMESNQEVGFSELIEELNNKLRDQLKSSDQSHIFDFNSLTSRIGKENIFEDKMYYLGDIKFSTNFLPKLGDEYVRYINAIFSVSKKCIVLDLDNTLWGGVLGEAGLEGISLGPTPQGRPFMEFQQCLLALYNRGIILAINSKNNENEALTAIRTHKNMVLKEKHFSAMRINWKDKTENLRSLSQEINIGLDSMVFIDDDNFNREMVKEFLPLVQVMDLPKDPALYVKALKNLGSFDTLILTDEDISKGQMYSQERQRRSLKEEVADLSDYLSTLNMEMTLELNNEKNVSRISQMTQKTNQFNMTTKRYTEEEIKNFLGSKDYRVYGVRLTDKFGDYGLTGLAIVNIKGSWILDTFLLSCRIIGRRVEEMLLVYVANEAKKENQDILIGQFIETEKNDPAKDFYKNMGMLRKSNGSREITLWELSLGIEMAYPECIKLIVQE